MTKLPRNVKGKVLVKVLLKMGFARADGRGSHIRLIHPDGRWTQVAIHQKDPTRNIKSNSSADKYNG